MAEFKRFVEARKRMEAFQVLELADVTSVVRVLQATDFTLYGEGDDFRIEVALEREGSTVIQTVRRGDFIVRHHWALPAEVWVSKQFHEHWEVER